ncbi:hypothetical protein J7438_15120 [Thalassotalea sp. G20_0]|uniref:hypothetical protein n=1 Tax=Thalassotalea sp. G20_0 TaxID=2821093 RepID=UPI001ADCB079|nr:hypothetical protein [Thalassotalea sp. G20_0]MBO9495408.1 hypothetical protein [Thalassotalea sp. G20_0]
MDVTGFKNDTVTGSDSTSERSYGKETGNYKYLTVQPSEDKEVLFHAGNFASDNTGTFGTDSPCSNSLFTLNDCKVSHSRSCSPKSIESEKSEKSKKSAEGHQKEAFSYGQVQFKQTKLLAMLTSGEVEKQCVKEELEKLVQQFDELHVNVSLMDKVNKLKREIEQYIDPHRLVGGEYNSKNGAPSRKTIADGIQIIARDIAIWAGTTTNNLKVLTYIIEQGFPIKQSSDWFDHDPESIAYLPFDTMTTLIDNCTPYCPDLLFVKAIFADADPRFDALTQTILTSRRISDGLFQEAIAQSIPAASQSRLKVFFNYLRSQSNASNMIKDLVKQSYEHHRIANLEGIHRYKNSVIMVFVLEAIAQQSQGEARTLIRSFCQDEQQLIAMTALLGGLHQSSELLNEMGITVTRQAFKEVSVNLKNSAFFMAKEAGLTNERLFTNTVNRIAPFLWTLPNEYGDHLHQRSLFPDNKVLSFIHLVMEQAAIYQKESQQWSGPNCQKELVLGDVSLWAAKIFSVTEDAVSADSLGLLQEDARYSETWNILINKAKCCNGLTRPGDFMKFMDWLLIEGLSLVRMESEYREKEATFTARQKSYRPDLWPDPHSKVSTTSSASHDQLVSYTKLVTTLHFDIIESFLRLAPSSHRIHVLNNWLTNPDCAKQRETLFRQPVYPLNNMECPNIWQLLLSLDKDYQPPENQFDHDWQIPVNPQQWTAPPPLASLLSESVEVYGRTLAIQRSDGGWDYLKFISDKEKPEDLATEGNKIRLMADIASRYGLKSSIPQVVGSYRWDNANIDLATFTPPAKKARLEEKCRYIDGKAGYCLHLKSTKDAPYHLYPYDLDPVTKADQICQGLHKYAHDSGVLFSCGLYAPAVIAADHDSVTKRKHHILSSYVGAPSEGRMLQWKKASEHPNVGPVGMRDSGDTKSMIELGEDYFFSKRYQEFLDFEKSEDRARVAFSELAKNAQGLILQYALCFQKQFNCDNRESTLNHERKIQEILTTLFHKAFPRFTEERVVQAMEEDELLSQAVREVIYWCGHDARFVNHIKQNIIPESTYPDCSEATNIVDFSTLEPRELIPGIGFVTRDNQPNLGVTFGVNPLVTLNALIVKLLALGALTSL